MSDGRKGRAGRAAARDRQQAHAHSLGDIEQEVVPHHAVRVAGAAVGLYAAHVSCTREGAHDLGGFTPSPPTKSLDFRGFDSSRLSILRGGNSHVRLIV